MPASAASSEKRQSIVVPRSPFSDAIAWFSCVRTKAPRSRAAPHMLSSISPRVPGGSLPSQAGSIRPRVMSFFTTVYLPENRSPSGMTAAIVPLPPKSPDSHRIVSGVGGWPVTATCPVIGPLAQPTAPRASSASTTTRLTSVFMRFVLSRVARSQSRLASVSAHPRSAPGSRTPLP